MPKYQLSFFDPFYFKRSGNGSCYFEFTAKNNDAAKAEVRRLLKWFPHHSKRSERLCVVVQEERTEKISLR